MNCTLVAALTGALLIAMPAAQAQTAPPAGAPPAVELYSAADA